MLPSAKSAFSYLDNSLELTRMLSLLKPDRNTFIITADIVSLYTNIPTGEGPTIVAQKVGKTDKEKAKLKQLLSLVLENNVFEFNGEFFKQKNGTAMGTIMAPTYANCYLRAKEEAGLVGWLKTGHPNVKLYKRYIDDILTIFRNHDNKLVEFIAQMRKAYAPLELTFKIGRTSIVYLDAELTLNDTKQRIYHELHRKPCNNKVYIPATSCHPTHMLENIVYNDMLRAHRLCNRPEKLKKHLALMRASAIKQGYSAKTVKKLERKAEQRAREPRVKSEEEAPTILTLTYQGERTRSLVSNIREEWCQSADKDKKLMIAYRTNSNMKNILVRSKAPGKKKPTIHQRVEI